MGEKLWILISSLRHKPADLDLHCFQKRIENYEKKHAHSALNSAYMVKYRFQEILN